MGRGLLAILRRSLEISDESSYSCCSHFMKIILNICMGIGSCLACPTKKIVNSRWNIGTLQWRMSVRPLYLLYKRCDTI